MLHGVLTRPAAGEILVSDAAAGHAGLEVHAGEHRELQLRGRREAVGVVAIAGGAARADG